MIRDWINSMRPKHWVKSGFCMAALIFSGQAGDLAKWLDLLPLVAGFCLLSSAGYLLNDALNVEEDRAHPRKKTRPLAAGRLTRRSVIAASGWLSLFSLVILFAFFGSGEGLVAWTPWVGLAYYVFTVSYSVFIRNVVFLDVLFLGLGFILRVTAGAVALNLAPTIWLLSCTYTIVLLIAFGKRRGELRVLNDHEECQLGDTRKALSGYSEASLNALITFCGVAAASLYFAYCMSRPDCFPFVLTGLPVLLGLLTYMRLVRSSGQVDAPEDLMLKNPTLLISVISWVALIVWLSVWGK